MEATILKMLDLDGDRSFLRGKASQDAEISKTNPIFNNIGGDLKS